MIKKLTLVVLTLGLFALASSSTPFDDFNKYVTTYKDSLKSFAEDFGGVLGANDFSSGRTLGFPGFEAGFDVAIQKKPSNGNEILKKSGVSSFGIPLVHASVGIPLTGLDVTLRGLTYSGLSIVGGGLRYNIFKSGMLTKFMPDLSVIVMYDTIDFDYFKGNHLSFDVVGSWNIPIIKPFIGAGLDRTKIEVRDVSQVVNGISETVSKTRYTLGLRFSPLPLVYIYGAYSIIHSETGYNFGLGVRF